MKIGAIHHPDGFTMRDDGPMCRCWYTFDLPSGKRGLCQALATWEIVTSVFGIPKHDYFCDIHKPREEEATR